MVLFSERNNLRKEIEKTYDISPDAYKLLFKTCARYLIHLAWLFPLYCPDDGVSIYSYSEHDLIEELRFEIPSLVDDEGFINPVITKDIWTNEETSNYDQYAILDFIEFIYQNIKDFSVGYHHSYFNHTHIDFLKTNNETATFLQDINKMFKRTGLLYTLKENGEIERIVLNASIIKEALDTIDNLQDKSLKELINDAISSFLKPGPKNIGNAVEKIWDAFERAKTYYVGLDKKSSSLKLISTISEGQNEMVEVLNKEFKELTELGNSFRIRHHETDKTEFVSDAHREYFFNRCLSLLCLLLNYIN